LLQWVQVLFLQPLKVLIHPEEIELTWIKWFGKGKMVRKDAEVAHLVEHDLAKVGVAGSSPVFRSEFLPCGGFFLDFRFGGPEALVVKLVDTQDLKSCLQQCKYRFKSDPGHK
jgi:hypothetical protein